MATVSAHPGQPGAMAPPHDPGRVLSPSTQTEGCDLSIRVFLADDHRLLVEGFRHALKDYGIDVAEVAYSTDGLIDRYFEVRPDVLVIDVRFDNKDAAENGLDVCEELLERDPAARISGFSQFDDQYIIEKSYKLGVLAFVRKDESPDVLNRSEEHTSELQSP